jgi:hypothetical protein
LPNEAHIGLILRPECLSLLCGTFPTIGLARLEERLGLLPKRTGKAAMNWVEDLAAIRPSAALGRARQADVQSAA